MNERTETVKTLLSSYKKSLYIRRALLALLVVLTALFQNTRGALLQVNGVRAMPLAVLVAGKKASGGKVKNDGKI